MGNETVYMHLIDLGPDAVYVKSNLGRQLTREEQETFRLLARRVSELEASGELGPKDAERLKVWTTARDALGEVVPHDYGQDRTPYGILDSAFDWYKGHMDNVIDANGEIILFEGGRDPGDLYTEIYDTDPEDPDVKAARLTLEALKTPILVNETLDDALAVLDRIGEASMLDPIGLAEMEAIVEIVSFLNALTAQLEKGEGYALVTTNSDLITKKPE